MDVSIIIPVKDDISGLIATLESFRSQNWNRHTVEIIVCNDGGPEAVSDVAHRFGYNVVCLPENRGSYAARNLGLASSRGDVLAFVDANERIHPEWLEAGLRALEHADYVGGKIVVELPPNPTTWQRYDQIAAFPVPYYVDIRRFAPTANLFVKRSVIEDVGCFNEALRSGGDREFGVRVHRAGYRLAHCEQAITYHPARDFLQQAKKVSRVARGSAELEYLAWGWSAYAIFLEALQEIGKALPRMLLRIARTKYGKSGSGTAWSSRLLMQKELVGIVYQWARIRYTVRLMLENRRSIFSSRIPILAADAHRRAQ